MKTSALGEELRRAIRDSKTSALALSKLTGVPQPIISGFLKGRDIKLSTAEKLAAHFRLALKRVG